MHLFLAVIIYSVHIVDSYIKFIRTLWVPELVINEEGGSRIESVLKICFKVRCARSC